MRGYLVALLAIVALAIAGCGGAGAIKAAPDAAKAEGIVETCLTKSHLSEKAFAACAAPKGHEATLEACATKAVTSDIPFHHSRLASDLANCVVTNR